MARGSDSPQEGGRLGRRNVRACWQRLIVGPGPCLTDRCCARAGGGPENVLVVVNSASWASQAVANEFIHLRRIPSSNVCYLDWDQGFGSTDVATFRRQILIPALEHIHRRGLDDQIDYVVYSSDFPTAIALEGDVRGIDLPDQLSPSASINSATYLAESVLVGSPDTVGLINNQYLRAAPDRTPAIPVHGFRSWYGWGPDGELIEGGGSHYLLSTMLAVTSGRGNSVSEAIHYLRRSAAADGTHPAGTIYFMKNDDRRSSARDAGYAAAAERLSRLGVAAVVAEGTAPLGRRDVQGLMTGTRELDWRRSGSTILPGALCEYFTSFGGVIGEGSPQTPLSELLRYGAAGASGTVAEPFLTWQKFPVPAMQIYYACGCTLAEAFYQSVSGPYQLLIVGDPLCRPWANIPAVTIADLKPDATLHGTVEIRATATFAARGKKAAPGADPLRGRAGRFELYVDGVQAGSAPADEPLIFDTLAAADGYHEPAGRGDLRNSAIETQGRRQILPVLVDNHGHGIQFTANVESTGETAKEGTGKKMDPSPTPAAAAGGVRWGQSLVLKATTVSAAEIVFFRQLAEHSGMTAGPEGSLVVNPRRLGTGPVRLQAAGFNAGEPKASVLSRPIELTIEANPPLPAWQAPRGVGLMRWDCCLRGPGRPGGSRAGDIQAHLADRRRREAGRRLQDRQRVRSGRHRHVSVSGLA